MFIEYRGLTDYLVIVDLQVDIVNGNDIDNT